MFLTDRHKLFHRRPIDNIGTELALKKFPSKHQLLLLRHSRVHGMSKRLRCANDAVLAEIADITELLNLKHLLMPVNHI